MTEVHHLRDTRHSAELFCGKPLSDRRFFDFGYCDLQAVLKQSFLCMECLGQYRFNYYEGTMKRLPSLSPDVEFLRFGLPPSRKQAMHLYRGRTGKTMLCGAENVAPDCAHLSEFEEGAEYCESCLERFNDITAPETEEGFLILTSLPLLLAPDEQQTIHLHPQVTLRGPYRFHFTMSDLLGGLRVVSLLVGRSTPYASSGGATPARLFHGDLVLPAHLDPRLLLPLEGPDLSPAEMIRAYVMNCGVTTLEVQLTVFARQKHSFPKTPAVSVLEMPSGTAHPALPSPPAPSEDLLHCPSREALAQLKRRMSKVELTADVTIETRLGRVYYMDTDAIKTDVTDALAWGATVISDGGGGSGGSVLPSSGSLEVRELLEVPEDTEASRQRKRVAFERLQQQKLRAERSILDVDAAADLGIGAAKYRKLQEADREATRIYLEERESWHADLDPDDP